MPLTQDSSQHVPPHQCSNTSPMINKIPDEWIIKSNNNLYIPIPFVPVNTLVRVQYNYNDKSQLIMEELKPIIKCDCCREPLTDNDNDGEGTDTVDGIVCDDCFSDDYFYCEQCNECHRQENVVTVFDNHYCSDSCAHGAGYINCDDCEAWVHNDDSYTNRNGNSICESCSDNYYSCHECGEIVHSDDTHYNDSTGNNYCSDCWRGSDDSLIKDYSYKPSTPVYVKMEYENTMYLGIELEVECHSNDSPSEKASLVKAWLDNHKVGELVYFKEDGSLSNGFEIVFMPMTLKGIHKKFPMKKFLRYLQDIKLTSHDKGTCGLHVHLSRKNLKETDVYKGKLFFYTCQRMLKKLSARTNGDRDDPFHFCKFDGSMPAIGDNMAGHFSALNISNPKTIEIRIFRGTLIYERFLASIQFADAFGEYIQKMGVAYLKNNHGSLVWAGFIAWVKQSGKYNQFLKYVIKKNII